MRFIRWLLILFLTVLAVTFAVSNTDIIVITLWPLPYEMTLPIAAVGFAGLLVGFVFGAFATWLNGGTTRARSRAERYTLRQREREVAALKKRLEQQGAKKSKTDTSAPRSS